MTFKGFEKENGEIVSSAYVDGYWFGDRLLEGVFFKITVDEKGKLKSEVREDCAKYFARLNKKLWLKEAVEFSKTNDIFYGEGDEELILLTE